MKWSYIVHTHGVLHTYRHSHFLVRWPRKVNGKNYTVSKDKSTNFKLASLANWPLRSVSSTDVKRHRYDFLLLFRLRQKESWIKCHSSLPPILQTSQYLPTMQPINSTACLVISSLGQTENKRWGWMPLPIYAPDCCKSPSQRSHLRAGDLMNYRGLFIPLKARWVTTLYLFRREGTLLLPTKSSLCHRG